jgi:hypothetical protein
MESLGWEDSFAAVFESKAAISKLFRNIKELGDFLPIRRFVVPCGGVDRVKGQNP